MTDGVTQCMKLHAGGGAWSNKLSAAASTHGGCAAVRVWKRTAVAAVGVAFVAALTSHLEAVIH